MSIIRTQHNKENPYVQLNKFVLEDPELSWAAKGLWAYLMSRPDNWRVSVSHLSTIYKEKGGGERAIRSLLNELIDVGYCKREQGFAENGCFEQTEYVIYELKNKIPRCSQAHAVGANAHERTPNKEGSKIIKETTTTKEDDDDVFFDNKPDLRIELSKDYTEKIKCFEQFEGKIESNKLKRLADKYPLDKIKTGCEATKSAIKANSIKTSLIQYLTAAIEGGWKPVLSADDKILENKNYAMNRLQQSKQVKDVIFDVGLNYVEIKYTKSSHSAIIGYDSANFKDDLDHTLRKYGLI